MNFLPLFTLFWVQIPEQPPTKQQQGSAPLHSLRCDYEKVLSLLSNAPDCEEELYWCVVCEKVLCTHTDPSASQATFNLSESTKSQQQEQLMLPVERITIFLSYCPCFHPLTYFAMQRTPLTLSSVSFSSHLSVCAHTTSQLLSVGPSHGLHFCCVLQKQLYFQGLTILCVFFPLLGNIGSSWCSLWKP